MMLIDRLQFSEEDHSYTLDGKRLPGVTEILGSLGLVNTDWFTPESRDRGRAVHLGIHLIQEGTLDWDSVCPQIVPYLIAYSRFAREMKLETLFSEQRMASARYRFAGTLDRGGWVHSRKLSLIDFKTGTHAAWMDIQLALYELLWRENAADMGIDPPEDRFVVELRADASYRIHSMKIKPAQLSNITSAILTLNLFKETK